MKYWIRYSRQNGKKWAYNKYHIFWKPIHSSTFLWSSGDLQDLLYNYESNLTTGEEIEIDEEKELSIVVDGQRSETDL